MHINEMLTILRNFPPMVLLFAASLVLSGCVPISWKDEEPRISEQQLQAFTLGVSTRADVREALGKPDLTRRDNRLWIYGWQQHHGKAAGITLVGTPPLIGPAPFFMPLDNSYHVVFIAFDTDGLLREIDLKEGEEDWKGVKDTCRQDGVCARYWKYFAGNDDSVLNPTGSERLDDSVTIITASQSEDDHAKQFVPDKTTCGVFLYAEKEKFWFSFEGLIDRPLDDKTYVFCESTPGMKKLSLYSGPQNYLYRYPFLKRLDCPAGENVYVSVHLHQRFFGDPHWTVTLETPAVGQENIKGRRLQLLRCPLIEEPFHAKQNSENRPEQGAILTVSNSGKHALRKDIETYCPKADSGNADSQAYIGDLYYLGAYELEQNLIQAYVWYSLAAKNGNSYANTQLRKLTKELNPNQLIDARRLLNEWVPGQCQSALYVQVSELTDKLLTLCREADTGNIKAQFELGRYYWLRNDIPDNRSKSFMWYMLSATSKIGDGRYHDDETKKRAQIEVGYKKDMILTKDQLNKAMQLFSTWQPGQCEDEVTDTVNN